MIRISKEQALNLLLEWVQDLRSRTGTFLRTTIGKRSLIVIPLLVGLLTFGQAILKGPGLDLVITYRYSVEDRGQFIRPEARIYFDRGNGTRQEDSIAVKLKSGVQLSKMSFPLPNDLNDLAARFDPSDLVPSQLEIYDMALYDRITGDRLEKVQLKRITTWKEGVLITETSDFVIIESLVDDPICKVQLKNDEPDARKKVTGLAGAILPSIKNALIAAVLVFAGGVWGRSLIEWTRKLPGRLREGFEESKPDLGWVKPVSTTAYIVGVILFVWLFRGNYEEFRLIEEPFTPQFASAKTPTSDALGIWMTGALQFHALNEPYVSTYRCLPAIWHASFLNLHFDVALVPVTMMACWLAVFTLFFFTANPLGRLYFLAGLWGIVLTYFLNFKAIAPHVFGPGMMAFGAVFVGVYLVTQAIFRLEPNRMNLLLGMLGFLSIGIAGVVRGPQLLAGVSLVILTVIVALLAKQPKLYWLTVLGGICFLLPGMVDGKIREAHKVTNNGWSALYCVYANPEHKWNSDIYIEGYLRPRPDDWEEQKVYHKEILNKFLEFRLSADGWKDLGYKVWQRTYLDGHSLTTVQFRIVGIGFLLFTLLQLFYTRVPRNPFATIWLCLHGLLPIILYAVDNWQWYLMGVLLLTYMIAMVVIGIKLRLWLTMVVILAGYACVIFHCSVGLTGSWRAAGTYSYFLFLAYLLAPLEYWIGQKRQVWETCWSGTKAEGIAGGAYLAFIAVGSLGCFLVKTDFEGLHRHFFLQEGEQRLVMKLSNDTNLNRSLYLPPLNVNHVFYTDYDHLQPGFFRVVDSNYKPKENGWKTLIDPLELSPPVPEMETQKKGDEADRSAALGE